MYYHKCYIRNVILIITPKCYIFCKENVCKKKLMCYKKNVFVLAHNVIKAFAKKWVNCFLIMSSFYHATKTCANVMLKCYVKMLRENVKKVQTIKLNSIFCRVLFKYIVFRNLDN